MSTVQPSTRVDEVRALVDQALAAADALELELVAAHLSMARDALGEDEAAD